MKHVYLHIGFHKTGSTTIQSLLNSNRLSLLEHGILYPESGRPKEAPEGHHYLPRDASKRKWMRSDTDGWPALLAEMSATNAQKIVLSSEGFESATPDEICELRSRLIDYDVRIIVYLRNPLNFMLSCFKQQVKSDTRYYKSFHHFIRQNVNRCHYALRLNYWGEHFGRDKVIARIYDQVTVEPGLLLDFLQLVGIPSDLPCAISDKNVSPDSDVIAALRLLNRFELTWVGRLVPGRFRTALRRRLSRLRFRTHVLKKLTTNFLPNSALYTNDDIEWLSKQIAAWNKELVPTWFRFEQLQYFAIPPVDARCIDSRETAMAAMS